MHVIITAPHGHPFLNDVVATPIVRNLEKLLHNTDITFEAFVNLEPRSSGDMNRPSTRGTPFRNLIEEAMKEGADFLLDIHGFPDSTTSPFKGYDIVVLQSYKRQGPLPDLYCKNLKKYAKDYKLKIDLQTASLENDVVKQAYEYGIPAVLVEHNELGPPETYAIIHAGVLININI